MTMIDLRYVKKLVEMLDESSVDSIEIASDKGMKIRISKTPQQRGAVQMAAPMTLPALLPAAVPAAAPQAAESNSAGLEVPNGGDLLQCCRAGSETVPHGRRQNQQRSDTLHHRSNENHERDRIRIRRCGERD